MNRGIGLVILVVVMSGVGVLAEYLVKPAQGAEEEAPEVGKPKPEKLVKSLVVEGNILKDGGFEERYKKADQHGNAFVKWSGWLAQGKGRRGADTEVKHSGNSSAWLEGLGGPCHIWHNQEVKVEAGSYRLTGYVRAAGVGRGLWGKGIVFAVEDAEKTGMRSKNSALPFGAYGWRKFERIYKFEQAQRVRLYFYLYGPGKMWLDDVSLVKLDAVAEEGEVAVGEPDAADTARVKADADRAARIAREKAEAARKAAAEAAARAPEKLIQDGGFEDTYKKVDQHGNAFAKWGGWKAEGKCNRGVDFKIKHGGKASAWLSGEGPCHIWHGQSLNTKTGYYKLTGYIRAQNVSPAKWNRAVVIAFEAKGAKTQSNPLPAGTYNWRKFERIYHFGADYAPNRLYIYMYGRGKAWLDDLKIEKLEGEHKPGLKMFDPEEGKVEAAVAPVEEVAAADVKAQTKPSGKDGVRLWQYVRGDTKEYFNYGLKIVPPWADGGHLRINFPEHLEYMPGTRGILRYSDRGAKGHWMVSKDGMSAELNVESVTEPGVFVHGLARAVSKNRIEITMEIINKTKRKTLGAIRPLYCHQYQPLKGFPQWRKNLEHTFMLMDGKLVRLSEIKTEKPSRMKGGSLKGSPQKNDGPFIARRGGWIDAGLDRAIVVVTSLDNKRALIMGWTPGKSCFTNGNIPCVHADPYYGDIKPGESKVAKEVIILTEEDPEKIVKQLIADGVGAPIAK